MAKNSSIEWTHHTFNPWWGCIKVSPACQHCYAETFAKRTGNEVWGPNAPRRFFGEDYWNNPIKWDKQANMDGVRRRVFCASMADVFEDRDDLEEWRGKLWELIEKTPNLDWLLLTKRPENIGDMIPWPTDWPENIWLGTTVENQKYADERLPHLLQHKATVRFLSCEPMLGPVDLEKWIKPNQEKGLEGIDWVIGGGESGPGARPMHPDWARTIRDQAQSAGIPFHFKQWGKWAPVDHLPPGTKGTKTVINGVEMTLLKSKKSVDRSLDGIIWDEFPNSYPVRENTSEKPKEEETTPPDDGVFPVFPEHSIAAFLNLYREWEMTLDEFNEITDASRLTHPDFPGISLPTLEIHDNEKFDRFLTTFYQQAVAYGKSLAKAEGIKKADGTKRR